MRIGFASTPGGCFHYRAEMPARLLADLGYETATTEDLEFGTEGGIGFPDAPDPDVVVLAAGWLRMPPALIERARACGQVIIADSDDWPWLPGWNPHALPEAGPQKITTMRAANLVTVSTAFMRRGFESYKLPAQVCRNVIDPEPFALVSEANREFCRRRASLHDELVIGYRGLLCGFHDGDVALLEGLLPEDHHRYVHVGFDRRQTKSFADLTGISPQRLENRPASMSWAEYPELLGAVDVAVIPLALGNSNGAKSCCAGLEWTAAGVPWIGPVQEEFQLISVGNTPAEMGQLLSSTALSDTALRFVYQAQLDASQPFFYGSERCVEGRAWEQAISDAVGAAGGHLPAPVAVLPPMQNRAQRRHSRRRG